MHRVLLISEPSPSERRPRIRASLPPPPATSSALLALKSPVSAQSITASATGSSKDADRSTEPLCLSSRNGGASAHPSALSLQNAEPGGIIHDVLAGGRSHTPPPSTATARRNIIDRLHRGESVRRLRKRQPRILCASQVCRKFESVVKPALWRDVPHTRL